MHLTFLKSKIHRATITESDLNYEGSILIDQELLDEAGILVNEKVDVLNINNGERFSTYVISGKAGSGDVVINGAAARKVYKGDIVIIIAYCNLDSSEVSNFKPKIVFVNKDNKIEYRG